MVLSSQKIPSLVELCVQTAIDNIRYLGDVGETDINLLKDILPHCTMDQLMHIEDSSKGRDLSPVTDNLWKRIYENQFGVDSVNTVIRRMKQKQVVFKWRLLYEAKVKERDEAQKKSVDRLKKLYEAEGARKQSRQIQLCSKVPPSSKKRFFSGGEFGASCSNGKGNLMKKARMEYLNSHEVKAHQAMKKNKLQRNSFSASSSSYAATSYPPDLKPVSRTMKPSSFLGKSPASNLKLSKPFGR